MADLTTKYLGLTLNSPIIVGSSGLTDSVDKIRKLENNGAGAVVLKSLFEEQILREAEYKLQQMQEDDMMYADYSETYDYIDLHIKEKELNDYIELIKGAKKAVMIPVIASINCVTNSEWFSFAKEIEKAGADALELNIFITPFNLERDAQEVERSYLSIAEKVKGVINIPVAIKLSPYFSNLGLLTRRIVSKGINGLVMFNRFNKPDIDIDKMEITAASVFSTPREIHDPLRWVAILSGKLEVDIAASTGVHSGQDAIKQLLAGAAAVQVVSAIYEHGPDQIVKMNNEIMSWMEDKGFNYVDQFKGKLNQSTLENPEMYERIQFMKYFSEIR